MDLNMDGVLFRHLRQEAGTGHEKNRCVAWHLVDDYYISRCAQHNHGRRPKL